VGHRHRRPNPVTGHPRAADDDAAAASRRRNGVRIAELLERQPPSAQDFTDLSQEWRRLFAELFGTFLLVTAGAGAAVRDCGRHLPATGRRHGVVLREAVRQVPNASCCCSRRRSSCHLRLGRPARDLKRGRIHRARSMSLYCSGGGNWPRWWPTVQGFGAERPLSRGSACRERLPPFLSGRCGSPEAPWRCGSDEARLPQRRL
jgi:hypothetical protein